MADSKVLAFGIFFGIVAIVAGSWPPGWPSNALEPVESTNRVRLQHSSLGRREGIPIKISARHHNEPEDEIDQHGVGEATDGGSVRAPEPTGKTGVGATPCQTTPQWEGRASEWDHLQGGNNRFNITFDGVNRRKRIMEDKHAQLPGKRIYEYILLYDEGIQYVINHNYNTCSIEPLGTWRNHTIPPNATLEDSYEIGAPGSGFLVQEWSDRIPGRQRESWIGTYTDQGCWPIMEIFMEKAENNTMIQSVTTRFFDLSTGIKNMSVFTPPSYCPQPRQVPAKVRPNSSTRPANARPSRREFPGQRRLPIFPQMPPAQVDLSVSRSQAIADLAKQRQILDWLKSGNRRTLQENLDPRLVKILKRVGK